MFLDPGQVFGAVAVLVVILISAYIFFRWSIVWNDSKADLTGKVAIVTGANVGIGFFTALDFAKRNAKVILACRNKEKAEAARDKIIAESNNKNIVIQIVDLTIMKSVRQFVERILAEESRLDILVNNAGVVSAGKPREVTDEGLETLFAANYFGPFLLTNLLLDLMKNSGPSRIVNVSSVANKWGTIDLKDLQAEKSWSIQNRYFDSKLANIMFTREIAKRLEGTGVTANSLHPGSVSTNLLRHLNPIVGVPVRLFVKLFCRTSEEGAQTSIYLAISEEVADVSGKHFVDCDIQEREANPMSRNMELAEQLWDVSAQLTGLLKVD